KKLISSIDYYQTTPDKNIQIGSITADSRNVKKGSLFVAIKGQTVDGHDFVKNAIKNGAVAVIGEKEKPKGISDIVYVKVNDSKLALGKVASKWYGNSSKKLKVIGVTGTDGKTTTAYAIQKILQESQHKTGLITSISAKIGKKEYSTGFHVTTPHVIQLHKTLNQMVKAGCEYAVVEVTSHGLDQERVAGVDFQVGVLTNITHEHLDYHKTKKAYTDAKLKLFERVKGYAVVNADDEHFESVAKSLRKGVKMRTYSAKQKRADILVKNAMIKKDKMDFDIFSDNKSQSFTTNLLGEYNAMNLAAAIVTAKIFDVDQSKIKSAIKGMQRPPGRLERIESIKKYDVFVDFAHTPNALRSTLTLLKERIGQKGAGRLVAVFGCAGERDTEKRPIMGKASTELADISVFTAEDPRSEDVNNIIDDMEGDLDENVVRLKAHDYDDSKISAGKHGLVRVPDRNEAICFAINRVAREKDTIVLLGKGHEESMAYGDTEHPWSDRRAAEEAYKLIPERKAIVLAAGKGTRMETNTPKVLNKLAGKPMVSYTLSNLRDALFGDIVVVVGYKHDEVIRETTGFVRYAYQNRQLGTGDAARKGMEVFDGEKGYAMVVNGDDSAFYDPETLRGIIEKHKINSSKVTFATLTVNDPTGLGRVKRDAEGRVEKIVEEKDAKEDEKRIKEVNIGLYVFDIEWFGRNVDKLEKTESGEYYIVDLIEYAIEENEKVSVYKLEDKNEWFGINTKAQLKSADSLMKEKLNNNPMI
ncbi:MAG: UDP-N-acetylmuramoyl-L-alanyl-D-glutamate--2,6-diaminopimelate ligase, partial [Candidatus Woesebacteria bacterium]